MSETANTCDKKPTIIMSNMKLDTLTVKQFNDICSDFESIGNMNITDAINSMDGLGFTHTMVFTALHNVFGECDSDEFYDAYYEFSVRV